MQSKRQLTLFVTAFIVVFGFLTMAAPAFAAAKEKVLYNFDPQGTGYGGDFPDGGLIADAAGNLYGVTYQGGNMNQCINGDGNYVGCGIVFQLTPGKGGTWTETVLYSFNGGTTDGRGPYASLIIDAAGNLYGTTLYGGNPACTQNMNPPWGCGVVFELSPTKNGKWKEKVLYPFNGTDGNIPQGRLVFDAAGNLYGTTITGGTSGSGAVFEITPNKNGKWKEKVLYNFCPAKGCTDGATPTGGLTFDAAGNLYGTTLAGGAYSGCNYNVACGTFFRLSPGKNGKWKEKVLHSFGNGSDGVEPSGGLISDAAGDLYGTAQGGGASGRTGCGGGNSSNGCGAVFELTPKANGKWTEKVLYSFGNAPDGNSPIGSLVLDTAGNLYGTTWWGGAYGSGCYGTGCGIAFRLAPEKKGTWKETVLHSFGNGVDAGSPNGDLIFDSAGNLYGTSWGGGTSGTNCGGTGCGTLFEITP